MVRKYHNHKPQTTLWHREEEPLNHHETPGRQIKQSNQLSLPHQDDCNTRRTQSNVQQNIEQLQTPTMGVTINKSQQQENHRLRTDSSLSHRGGASVTCQDKQITQILEIYRKCRHFQDNEKIQHLLSGLDQGYKTFSMPNSIEHKIYRAREC